MIKSIKIFLSAFVFTLTSFANAQKIVNIVFVNDNGITEDIKAANSFIVIKENPNGIFERLDYKMGAPLIVLQTYNDSNLSNLHGKYLKYLESGSLKISGQCSNNQKSGDWVQYNDTGKIILKEIYENNVLIETVDLDKVNTKDSVKFNDGREANIKGGNKAWIEYLKNSLLKMPEELLPIKGKVRVMFTVNTEGKITDVYLKQSAQFGLNEEALKIIRNSPNWVPAFQNGHLVNAYRIQPLTFFGETE